MIGRFSLYGFLKNQQYYDPFIILAFLEKGLTFTMIGLLIGFRGVCMALLETPTGAVADVVGRRRSMIASHMAYIISFVLFGLTDRLWLLFGAMFLFSIGEAFRTGTHKAIIFGWLAHHGRSDEKIRVYGVTRSWAKIGSAVSVVIAAGLVFATQRYSVIFLFSIVPYLANIALFLTYPAYLDGPPGASRDIGTIVRLLIRSVRHSLTVAPLRRLFVESMGFGGVFSVCKVYLQPIVKSAALAVPVLIGWGDRQRTAVLIAIVYVILNLLGSLASRRADALVKRAGSPQRGARLLWLMNLGCYGALAAGALLPAGGATVAIIAFVALAVGQNFWRPIQVSRFAEWADPSETATLLSIESQAKSLTVVVVAPLLGIAVDAMPAGLTFLPVGLVGLLAAAAVLATRPGTQTHD